MNEFQTKYGPAYAQKHHPSKPRCHLQVVGFPCNQFEYQEPGKNSEILNCLKYVRPGHNFVPNFPLSGRLDVNGENEHDVFTFLKSRCAAPMGFIGKKEHIIWNPVRDRDVSWNFQKWLIGSDGHPYRRYSPPTKPEAIEKDIISMITKCAQGGPSHDNDFSFKHRN